MEHRQVDINAMAMPWLWALLSAFMVTMLIGAAA
jgi:hypothetical protein